MEALCRQKLYCFSTKLHGVKTQIQQSEYPLLKERENPTDWLYSEDGRSVILRKVYSAVTVHWRAWSLSQGIYVGCGAWLGVVYNSSGLGDSDTIYLITTLTWYRTQYSWVRIPLNSCTTVTRVIPFWERLGIRPLLWPISLSFPTYQMGG
jgi:hypothetical protein